MNSSTTPSKPSRLSSMRIVIAIAIIALAACLVPGLSFAQSGDTDGGAHTTGVFMVGTIAPQADGGQDSKSYQLTVDISEASGTLTGDYYALLSLPTASGERYYLQKLNTSETNTVSINGPFVEQWNPNAQSYIEDVEPTVTLLKGPSSLAIGAAVSRQDCTEMFDGCISEGNFVTTSSEQWKTTVSFKGLSSGSDTGSYKVTLSFVDKRGSKTRLENLSEDPIQGKSAILVRLSRNGSDKTVAWALKEINADELNDDAYWEGSFDSFMICDANGKATSETVQYNPTDFQATVRYFYHEASWSSFGAGPGVTYEGATASATDWVPGYSFSENLPNGDSQSDLYQYKAFANTYQLKVDFDPQGMQTGDDTYYVLLEVPHETTGKAYFLQKIDPSKQTETFVVNDASTNQSNWKSSDGSDRPNERFSSEESVSVYILSSPNANLSVADAAGKNNCTYYAEGAPFSSDLYVFSKDPRVTQPNETEKLNVVTDTISLRKLEVSNDYDFLSILGPGAYYGISADTFNQQNHIQTNFAANHYNGNNEGVDPDLAGNSGVVVAAEGTKDADGKIIKFGESHVNNVLFYVGNGDANCLVNPRDWVYVVPSNYDDLSANIVEPILEHGDRMSTELLAHNATFGVSPASDNKVYIDTLDFPDDATVYIDGDAIKDYLFEGKLNITKTENQLLVFNFKTAESVKLGEYCVRYSRSDEYTKTDTPTTKGDKNTWLDGLAKHIVWNCASVKSLELGITTGMYLVPRDDSETVVSGTSSGWIISDGTVRNPSGEWHFNYGGLADVQTTNLTIGKTIDGKVPTASQVFDFEFDHLVTTGDGDPYWSSLKNYAGEGDNQTEVPWTNHNGEIKLDNITQMEDGWNIYRIKESRVGEHTAGTYVLDDREIYAAVEYKLLTSNGSNDVHHTLKVASVPAYFIECAEDEEPDWTFGEETFTRAAGSLAEAFGAGGTVKLKRVAEPAFQNSTEGAPFVPVMFTGTKTLKGGTLAGNDFSFELVGTSDNASSTHLSAYNDSTGKISFGSVSYSKAGTYKYIVREVGEESAGVERDGTTHTVVVTVAEDEEGDEGALKASVTVDGESTGEAATGLDFTNTVLSGTATVSVAKTVRGNAYSGDEDFTFVLAKAAGSSHTSDVLPENTRVSIKNGATADFGAITYSEEGTYYYTVSEIRGSTQGMSYAAEPLYVQVKVERNTNPAEGEGTLKTSVAYGTDLDYANAIAAEPVATAFSSSSTPTVVNTYAKTSFTPSVTKMYSGQNGAPLPAATFSFALADKTANEFKPGEVAPENGAAATLDMNGAGTQTVDFGTFTYTKPGTYVYEITEDNGDVNGVHYSAKKVTVTVAVSADATTGALTAQATVSGGDNDEHQLVNTYEELGDMVGVNLSGTKTLNNGQPGSRHFDFAITPDATNPTSGVNEDGLRGKQHNSDNGAIDFGRIVFSEQGTWRYTVKETSENGKGVTVDNTVYTVTYEVTKNTETDKLEATRTITKQGSDTPVDAIVFANTYATASATLDLSGTKTLVGGELQAGDYSFELVDESGKVQQTTSNAADGTYAFTQLVYDAAGTYTYTVREKANTAANIERDDTVYNVTVEVTDNHEGALVATPTIVNDATHVQATATTLNFKNTKLLGSAQLAVGKAFENAYNGSEAFAFTLDFVSGPEGGYTMVDPLRVSVASGNSASFGTIAFTKVGTYFFKIVEEAGESTDIEYNTEPRYAMVTVTRNTEADAVPTLKTDVKYGMSPTAESCAASSLIIVNKVKETEPDDDTFKVKVSKVEVGGGDEVAGAHIQVIDKDNKVVAEWVSTEEPHEVEGLAAGEYTLRETVAPTGYAIASDTHFTIAADGTVSSSDTSISDDGVLLVEDELLTCEATLSVTKKVTASVPLGTLDWLDTASFTFTLAEEDGTVVETKNVKAGETAKFAEITFNRVGTYYYTITETAPASAIEDLSYDTDPKWAKVVVKANATNTALEKAITYGSSKAACDASDAATESITVTNSYAVPALEKYVNKDVHQDLPAFDKPFVYDILAFVPLDAEKVVITDTLAKGLGVSFLNGNNTKVTVEDIGPDNDHTAHGTVEQAPGETVENAETVVQGKTLTVTVPNATSNRGHWLRLTYQVKLDNDVVSVEDDYKSDKNKDDINDNKTVISEDYPEHEGVATTASYVVYTASDLEAGDDATPKYSLEANDITVTPPTINVPVSKVWLAADGSELAWPSGAEVTVELLGNGESLDTVTTNLFGADKALAKQTVKLTADNPSATFVEMPVYESVTYSVAEKSVTGVSGSYTSSVSSVKDDSGVTSFKVTNIAKAVEEKDDTKKDDTKKDDTKKDDTKKDTTKKTSSNTKGTSAGTTGRGTAAGSTSPKTGDDIVVWPAVLAVVASACVATVAVRQLRRRS